MHELEKFNQQLNSDFEEGGLEATTREQKQMFQTTRQVFTQMSGSELPKEELGDDGCLDDDIISIIEEAKDPQNQRILTDQDQDLQSDSVNNTSFEESIQDFTGQGNIKATTNYKKTVYYVPNQRKSAEKCSNLIGGVEKQFKEDRYINDRVEQELEDFKRDIEVKF
jgi:hypothetical protein